MYSTDYSRFSNLVDSDDELDGGGGAAQAPPAARNNNKSNKKQRKSRDSDDELDAVADYPNDGNSGRQRQMRSQQQMSRQQQHDPANGEQGTCSCCGNFSPEVAGHAFLESAQREKPNEEQLAELYRQINGPDAVAPSASDMHQLWSMMCAQFEMHQNSNNGSNNSPAPQSDDEDDEEPPGLIDDDGNVVHDGDSRFQKKEEVGGWEKEAARKLAMKLNAKKRLEATRVKAVAKERALKKEREAAAKKEREEEAERAKRKLFEQGQVRLKADEKERRRLVEAEEAAKEAAKKEWERESARVRKLAAEETKAKKKADDARRAEEEKQRVKEERLKEVAERANLSALDELRSAMASNREASATVVMHDRFDEWLGVKAGMLEEAVVNKMASVALDLAERVGAGANCAKQYTYVAGEKVELPWKFEYESAQVAAAHERPLLAISRYCDDHLDEDQLDRLKKAAQAARRRIENPIVARQSTANVADDPYYQSFRSGEPYNNGEWEVNTSSRKSKHARQQQQLEENKAKKLAAKKVRPAAPKPAAAPRPAPAPPMPPPLSLHAIYPPQEARWEREQQEQACFSNMPETQANGDWLCVECRQYVRAMRSLCEGCGGARMSMPTTMRPPPLVKSPIPIASADQCTLRFVEEAHTWFVYNAAPDDEYALYDFIELLSAMKPELLPAVFNGYSFDSTVVAALAQDARFDVFQAESIVRLRSERPLKTLILEEAPPSSSPQPPPKGRRAEEPKGRAPRRTTRGHHDQLADDAVAHLTLAYEGPVIWRKFIVSFYTAYPQHRVKSRSKSSGGSGVQKTLSADDRISIVANGSNACVSVIDVFSRPPKAAAAAAEPSFEEQAASSFDEPCELSAAPEPPASFEVVEPLTSDMYTIIVQAGLVETTAMATLTKHEIDRETLFLLDDADFSEIGLTIGATVKLRRWIRANQDRHNAELQQLADQEAAFQTMTTVDNPPEVLCCPLTHELLREPVRLPCDNQTYERDAISAWLEQHATSPMTRAPATVDQLEYDSELAARVHEYQFGGVA